MCMLLAFIVRHEAMKGNLKKTPTCENATQRGPCSTALFAQTLLHYSYCVPCPSLSVQHIHKKCHGRNEQSNKCPQRSFLCENDLSYLNVCVHDIQYTSTTSKKIVLRNIVCLAQSRIVDLVDTYMYNLQLFSKGFLWLQQKSNCSALLFANKCVQNLLHWNLYREKTHQKISAIIMVMKITNQQFNF